MAYSWAPRCPFIVLASNQSQESKRLTTWKAGKCQRKAERPAFTCSFVKPSRHLDVGKTSATPLTKEYRNRNAPELSAQRLLSLAQYQPEQTQGPSELPQVPRPLPCAPYTATPRPGPGAGAQSARASAGPRHAAPLPRATPSRSSYLTPLVPKPRHARSAPRGALAGPRHRPPRSSRMPRARVAMPRRPPPRVLQPPALPARPAARTPGALSRVPGRRAGRSPDAEAQLVAAGWQATLLRPLRCRLSPGSAGKA